MKNIYKTKTQTKSIEYKLQEENIKNKNSSQFLIDSIKIEKEEVVLSIPFEFEIDAYNDKLNFSVQNSSRFFRDKTFINSRRKRISI